MNSPTTIDAIASAVAKLSSAEITDRLRAVNSEQRALLVLVRATRARERVLKPKSAHGREASHAR